MHNTEPRQIKTGGNPRSFPDYAALRDELSKLTHPARPDVNWRDAERYCLALFEQNGVELQTAAWYTVTRMQLAGLAGLNEGLAIMEALLSHQWGALWPQPIHARMEILSSLSQRIQQLMRTLPLNYSDLSQLYAAEQRLSHIAALLERLELKHLSQIDTLCTLMHNSAARLENSDSTPGNEGVIQPGIVLPVTPRAGINTVASATKNRSVAAKESPASDAKWVYVAQVAEPPKVDVPMHTATPPSAWKPFIAGIGTMLVVSIIAASGWYFLHRPDPLQTQLALSVTDLPAPLTPPQLERLRQQAPLSSTLLTQTQQQLTRLAQLPPDWNITYGRQLVKQAQVLWPQQAKSIAKQWQEQLDAVALPAEAAEGWHQGMEQLQQLSLRLNGLDERKGKYITVSELKSIVFTTQQAFNRAIPAEEQLRQLAQTPAGQPLPAAANAQIVMHLQQLIARYARLSAPDTNSSLPPQSANNK